MAIHLSPSIASSERVLLGSGGLKIQLHPHGTAVEGEWEPAFAAIQACHQAVHAMGCSRIYTNLKVSTRTDKDQTLEDKAVTVQASLPRGAPHPAAGTRAAPGHRNFDR